MIKVFYWCPYLSHVATIDNVIKSARSLVKYNKSYSVSLIETIGEWQFVKNKLYRDNIEILKLNNLNFKSYKVGYLKSRLYLIYLFIFNFFPLLNLLKNKKPDYLIVHLLTSLPLFILLIFRTNTKIILRISGLPKFNIFRKILWKLISHKVYLVTCPSEETLSYMKKLNIFDINKLELLYDPIVNVSAINEKKKINTKINPSSFFLNIGRLTNQKNQKLLIDTFYNLKKKNKNLSLIIIGEGENRSLLVDRIKELNLQKNIFLLGFKDNVFSYIKHARAVIISSLWEDPGAVMIEAAFCNTTIISSNCPNGPNEFISNNQAGYLFENNNLSSLENSLELFLNDTKNQIYNKKIFAKKKSKNFTCFNHYKMLNKILND